MTRPQNLRTRIFLDSGDPAETREVIALLGFLDGQTTNPTLVSKNPQAKARLKKGKRFTQDEILQLYQEIVEEISRLIPQGSVSVEVYADQNTPAKEMFRQGKEMFSWIPNAHIKYPTTREGLLAAQKSLKAGLRVNLTLCFTQEQAAAVYSATKGAKRGDVFVSPFVGRLDDRGLNGMDLIKNILRMYQKGDGHVEVLTASVRNLNHLLYALKLGSDIITAPLRVLKEWARIDLQIPTNTFTYEEKKLKRIPFRELDLTQEWHTFNLQHELTNQGMQRFSADWNALVGKL